MGIVTNAKLGAVGLIAVAIGISEGDKRLNYVQTDAIVTSAKVDCYVKNGKRELVEKATDKRAYMDCDMASYAAKEFGYSQSDISNRTQLAFKFKSPVDGSQQMGDHTDEYSANYKVGQKIQIYAHKSDPAKSRW